MSVRQWEHLSNEEYHQREKRKEELEEKCKPGPGGPPRWEDLAELEAMRITEWAENIGRWG